MRLACFAALWLLILGAALPAAATEDRDARIAAAREIMVFTGGDKLAGTIIEAMAKQLKPVLNRRYPGRERDVDGLLTTMAKLMLERRPALMSKVAELYADRFTAAELRELKQFYETPLGAKLIAQMPGITQQSMLAGRQWGQEIAREVFTKARDEFQKKSQ